MEYTAQTSEGSWLSTEDLNSGNNFRKYPNEFNEIK